jgi:hypothetical protein
LEYIDEHWGTTGYCSSTSFTEFRRHAFEALRKPLEEGACVPQTCRKRNSTDRYGLIPVWPL